MQEIKTQESLTKAVEFYQQIKEEIERLELSKKIARERIIERFQENELRVYDTGSGLRARVYTRKGREFISVVEAKELLDEDTFDKLLKIGDTIVVLSVMPIKAEEES